MACVRNASEADIDAITSIYAHYVRHNAATFEIEPPDTAEMDRRRSSSISRGLPYIVAEVESEVAGYAYASPYRLRPAYRFTVEDSVYIHPNLLGRGLGRLLLSHLIEDCEARCYRQMVAIIGDTGNTASIRLHQALGFRMVGTLEGVGRKFDRWVDTVIMQRPLHAAIDGS